MTFDRSARLFDHYLSSRLARFIERFENPYNTEGILDRNRTGEAVANCNGKLIDLFMVRRDFGSPGKMQIPGDTIGFAHHNPVGPDAASARAIALQARQFTLWLKRQPTYLDRQRGAVGETHETGGEIVHLNLAMIPVAPGAGKTGPVRELH